MNILASWKWLNEWVDLTGLSPSTVARRVSLSGPGIEKIIPQGVDLEEIVVGQISVIEPHPQADRLRVTKVDVGGTPLSIVCGGSNLEVGQWVVVAKIGSSVRWHGEGEPITLQPTEIRGVASEGMICAANEIGLFDAFPHGEKEILDLGKALPDHVASFRVGQPLAEVLGISGDVLLDTEITTNRPDAMGMEGFSREVAAILALPWKAREPAEIVGLTGTFPVKLTNTPEKILCSRFCAVKVGGVRVGPSPWWLQQRLLATGLRPINILADITNYVLLEMAQPLHVYDAEKLQGGLTIAPAVEGESFLALNGQTYQLTSSMLTVRDELGAVAIAGIIGGARAAVSSETTSIVFEGATFNEVSVRRTSRALDLATDASKLYERGLSSEAPRRALLRALQLCLELAGGHVASQIADERGMPYHGEVFKLKEEDACRLMGITLSSEEMQAILERLGFGITRSSSGLEVLVPWWRDHDIEGARDLVEEIARVYGYANMTPVFPAGMSPVPSDPSFAFESRLRALSKGFGFTELMGYSFVSKEQLERVQIDQKMCVHLLNPLSQDAEFMRPSLGPSLLQAVVDNQERAAELRVFELSNIYWRNQEQPTLPEERAEFVMGIASKASEPWTEAKGIAEALLRELGITSGAWQRWEGDQFWHPGRTLQYVIDGQRLFTVGELHPQMAETWKIDRRLGLVHVFVVDLQKHTAPTKAYKAIPIFPEVERDLALVVANDIEIARVEEALFAADTQQLLRRVTWFDTFREASMGEGKKSLAFHLTFRAEERTLASEEIDSQMQRLRQALEQSVGAVFRG